MKIGGWIAWAFIAVPSWLDILAGTDLSPDVVWTNLAVFALAGGLIWGRP